MLRGYWHRYFTLTCCCWSYILTGPGVACEVQSAVMAIVFGHWLWYWNWYGIGDPSSAVYESLVRIAPLSIWGAMVGVLGVFQLCASLGRSLIFRSMANMSALCCWSFFTYLFTVANPPQPMGIATTIFAVSSVVNYWHIQWRTTHRGR